MASIAKSAAHISSTVLPRSAPAASTSALALYRAAPRSLTTSATARAEPANAVTVPPRGSGFDYDLARQGSEALSIQQPKNGAEYVLGALHSDRA